MRANESDIQVKLEGLHRELGQAGPHPAHQVSQEAGVLQAGQLQAAQGGKVGHGQVVNVAE